MLQMPSCLSALLELTLLCVYTAAGSTCTPEKGVSSVPVSMRPGCCAGAYRVGSMESQGSLGGLGSVDAGASSSGSGGDAFHNSSPTAFGNALQGVSSGGTDNSAGCFSQPALLHMLSLDAPTIAQRGLHRVECWSHGRPLACLHQRFRPPLRIGMACAASHPHCFRKLCL